MATYPIVGDILDDFVGSSVRKTQSLKEGLCGQASINLEQPPPVGQFSYDVPVAGKTWETELELLEKRLRRKKIFQCGGTPADHCSLDSAGQPYKYDPEADFTMSKGSHDTEILKSILTRLVQERYVIENELMSSRAVIDKLQQQLKDSRLSCLKAEEERDLLAHEMQEALNSWTSETEKLNQVVIENSELRDSLKRLQQTHDLILETRCTSSISTKSSDRRANSVPVVVTVSKDDDNINEGISRSQTSRRRRSKASQFVNKSIPPLAVASNSYHLVTKRSSRTKYIGADGETDDRCPPTIPREEAREEPCRSPDFNLAFSRSSHF
eukprot:TRINITY_DN825_c0_g1_i2.p1 TRINITY_DN825_c0_g1~~TRINITY_DN825_c0_g1_i2.p1  ORF type:complete len:326 (+),score=18.00 TRINITY_DN825_c0_g1_i2:68-1045(+)